MGNRDEDEQSRTPGAGPRVTALPGPSRLVRISEGAFDRVRALALGEEPAPELTEEQVVELELAGLLVGEGVDSGQLANRFEKEILKEQGNASRLEAKLGNASFVSNAPEDVVAAEKSKLDELRRRIEKLSGYVADLR